MLLVGPRRSGFSRDREGRGTVILRGSVALSCSRLRNGPRRGRPGSVPSPDSGGRMAASQDRMAPDPDGLSKRDGISITGPRVAGPGSRTSRTWMSCARASP